MDLWRESTTSFLSHDQEDMLSELSKTTLLNQWDVR